MSSSWVHEKIDKSPHYLVVGVGLYAFLISIFIQEVVLPFFVPGLHGGFGLLTFDSINYHRQAVRLAQSIDTNGWSVWEISPNGQFPVGLTGFLYAITGWRDPSMVAALNSICFGFCALELWRLISRTHPNPHPYSLMFLILFPTSAMVYSQISKDIFSILATFIFVNTLVDLHKLSDTKFLLITLLRFCISLLLMGFVRSYGILLLIVVWWAAASFTLVKHAWEDTKSFLRLVFPLMMIALVHLVAIHSSGIMSYSRALQTNYLTAQPEAALVVNESSKRCEPGFLNDLFCRINVVRKKFVTGFPNANTNIDHEIEYQSFSDWVDYAPRALQLGLFSPFPNAWATTTSNLHPIKRLISGVEMTAAYLIFLSAIALVVSRRITLNLNMMTISIFSIGLLLVNASVFANLGTLYRMRLAPWHTLLSMCLMIVISKFFKGGSR